MTDNSGPDWVFNLHDTAQGIPRTLAKGITTRIFPGDQAMISVVRIEPHSVGTLHSHPQEQWGVLLEGALTRRRRTQRPHRRGGRIQGGEEVAVEAGDFWRTPGGVEHEVASAPARRAP